METKHVLKNSIGNPSFEQSEIYETKCNIKAKAKNLFKLATANTVSCF